MRFPVSWTMRLLFTLCLAPLLLAGQTPAPLSDAASIQRLPKAEAVKNPSVHLQGIVTLSLPRWNLVFVQDATSGIYCDLSVLRSYPKLGTEVILEGNAAVGSFQPYVIASQVRELEIRPLPAPIEATAEALWSGKLDGNRVRVRGYVQSFKPDVEDPASARLEMISNGKVVRSVVIGGMKRLDLSQGDLVEVDGVYGPEIDSEGKVVGVDVNVPRAEDLKLIQTLASIAASVPTTPIDQLMRQTNFASSGLVRVAGTVAIVSASELYLLNGIQGIQIHSAVPVKASPGQELEVLGFTYIKDDQRGIELCHHRWIQTNALPFPPAQPPAAPQTLTDPSRQSSWVTVEGDLVHRIQDGARGDLLIIVDGSQSLEARLRYEGQQLGPRINLGSRIQVSGVLRIMSKPGTIPSPRILVPSKAQVRVLTPPPWPIRKTLGVVSGLSMALATLLGALAVVYGRIREAKSRAEAAEDELRQVNSDLERRIEWATSELRATNARLTVQVEERERHQQISRKQAEILELIARSAPLEEILSHICRSVETEAPDVFCSILLVTATGSELTHAAAPSLPGSYLEKLNSVPVAPTVGSCGAAAFGRKPVYIESIAESPNWRGYRELALAHGLKACWSTPILGDDQALLGTFALYRKEEGLPEPRHLSLIEVAAHTAAIGISQARRQHAIRDLADRLDIALTGAKLGVWEWDPHTQRISLSAVGSSIYGVPERELDSAAVDRLVVPQDLGRLRGVVAEALAKGAPFRVHYRIIRPDGECRWIESMGRGDMSQNNGNLADARITAVFQDVTESKTIEEAFRALVPLSEAEAGPAFFAKTCDQLSRVFRCPMALVGEFPPDGMNRIRSLAAWVDGALQMPFEKWLEGSPCAQVLNRAGSVFHVPTQARQLYPTDPLLAKLGVESYIGILIQSAEGAPIGMMVVMDRQPTSITPQLENVLRLFAARAGVEIERGRHLDALRIAEARLRSAIENAYEGLVLTDIRGRITYATPAVAQITGCTVDHWIGKRWRELVLEEDLERLDQHIQRLLVAPGTRLTVELRVKHQDGGFRWIQCSDANQLDDPSLHSVVSNFRDITQQRATESAREKLEADLQQSQKMEALGTLAGGIAHDFNNILGAIMGCAGLVRVQCGDNAEALQNLDDLLKASNRAKELVKQILTFSRRQDYHRVVIDPVLILTESARLLKASLPATVTLQVKSGPNLPAILADPTLIQQIILNLATNAAQALDSRLGEVHLDFSPLMRTEEDPQDAPPQLKPGRYAVLTVRDNGLGMAESVQRRMFEPFFTTKAPGQGTGLGLAVVHGIARAHDAEIQVASQPGVGTTFKVYFPEAVTQDTPVAAPVPAVPTHHRHGRIMLVDDEDSLLRVTQRVLTLGGCEVKAFHRPDEALEHFEKVPTDFDLVITDYSMPGFTGLELGRRLRELNPHTPLILCTGYNSGVTEAEAERLGFAEVLLKPLAIEELWTAVDKVLPAAGNR